MITDKANLLCILSILKEYSDENHILRTKDIMEKMEKVYDKTVDRRTIYSAIIALQDFGYEIENYEDNGVGYRLLTKEFDPGEIKLLIDAVFSCPYISKKQTETLLEKLRSFLSESERKNYSYTNIITPEKKSPNPEVFLNIEILEEAINNKKMISFTYMDYGMDKKLSPKRERPYIVSPYAMICEGNHYYLALVYQGQKSPSFYRIDMMKNIKILDQPIELGKKEANLDSLNKVVYAHTGEPQRITLSCKNTVLRYVLEEFGNDIMIAPIDDEHFTATFMAAAEGLVYWALQYLGDVEVVAPESVRAKIKERIESSPY